MDILVHVQEGGKTTEEEDEKEGKEAEEGDGCVTGEESGEVEEVRERCDGREEVIPSLLATDKPRECL